jgi:hypothetical protein
MVEDGVRLGRVISGTQRRCEQAARFYQRKNERRFQFTDHVSIVHGTHTFKVVNKPKLTVEMSGRPRATTSVVFADENSGAEDGCPQSALIANRRLRDIHGADDFVGNAIDLFFLVPGQIRIKFHV